MLTKKYVLIVCQVLLPSPDAPIDARKFDDERGEVVILYRNRLGSVDLIFILGCLWWNF